MAQQTSLLRILCDGQGSFSGICILLGFGSHSADCCRHIVQQSGLFKVYSRLHFRDYMFIQGSASLERLYVHLGLSFT